MASSVQMMERMGVGLPGMTPQTMPTPSVTGGMPATMNLMMVPRCTFKMEKTKEGMKIHCTCDDAMSTSMMQNLCSALMGSMCSCCMTMNGMMVCCCNLTMGMCKVESTEHGVCITCTSGDPQCCEMIQACCDCMCCMMDAGCSCCVMMNNTPVCCGSCESGKQSSSKGKR